MQAIALTQVHHAYGRHHSLQGIDLHCPAGAITCLLGASGCGKSTLLRCIAGHEVIHSGTIRIGDQILADGRQHVRAEQRRIGMVFQDHALFPHLRLWQNVAFGLRHLRRGHRRAHACAMLQRFGLGDLAERFPHACSGGQQQRVALARALAPDPQALLLDEPFSGLDTGLRDRLRDDLLPVLRDAGIATVLVTHDPQEALACADRIAVMRAGALAQVGTPAELWQAPVDLATMAFFGPIHQLPVIVTDGHCATPLGPLPSTCPDGPAILALRDTALEPSTQGLIVSVLDQQPLGAMRRSHLRLADGTSLWIRHRDRGPLATRCPITLDPTQIRIFSA